jgi:glutathione S-transferase
VPWLIRPIARAIADRIIAGFLFPNVVKHFTFLESQLATSPGGGSYICGQQLTAADIALSYALLAGRSGFKTMGPWEKGSPEDTFPGLFDYIDRLEKEPGWLKSVEKIRQIEGNFSLVPGRRD